MALPKVGNLAPAFSLPNQDGKKIALKDFRGKKHVVLYFYPKALTPGCTVQACGLRDSLQAIKHRNAIVLGVSPDPVQRLPKFIDKYELNFDLLADEDHAVAERYGVWGKKKFMGREFIGLIRTTFIIDKQGRLQFIMEKVNTKTHHDAVLEQLEALSFQ